MADSKMKHEIKQQEKQSMPLRCKLQPPLFPASNILLSAFSWTTTATLTLISKVPILQSERNRKKQQRSKILHRFS